MITPHPLLAALREEINAIVMRQYDHPPYMLADEILALLQWRLGPLIVSADAMSEAINDAMPHVESEAWTSMLDYTDAIARAGRPGGEGAV